MSTTVIDAIYAEHVALLKVLDAAGEVSIRSSTDAHFRKVLLLSAASYFEHQIQRCIMEFAHERAHGDSVLLGLVKAKAVERQYHTYFQWSGSNANQFFGLFGSEFKVHMQGIVRGDPDLAEAIRSFLEVGRLRNELVHENFAIFPLDKTGKEIYDLYKKALPFVECLPARLRELQAGSIPPPPFSTAPFGPLPQS